MSTQEQITRAAFWRKARKIISLIVLCAIALFYLSPIIWLADVSFRPRQEIFLVPPAIFNYPILDIFDSYSFESFMLAERDFGIVRAFFNSSFITVTTVILTMLICSLCAYAFAFLKFPGRTVLFVSVLATMMIPQMTMIVPLYQVLSSINWLDTHWALIIPAAASPLGVFLLRQFYVRLPYELYEAAVVDGASRFRIWWQIIMPLGAPAMSTLAIYQFLFAWNNFMIPMIVLRTEELYTLPIKIQIMLSRHIDVPYQEMMATGLLSAIVPIVIFLIFQRQFIERYSGGLKG